jgi:mannitol-1-phosphate/altronate dehydrogenase
MCKIVQPVVPPLHPPAPGLDWAVVAEPFYGIPIQEHAVAAMRGLPRAIEPQAPARFRASEDVKMLAHNGLHFVLACLGYLRGAQSFPALRDHADLMALGRGLLVDEAGAALFAKHGDALGRSEYLNYCDSILRRITCPVLNDPISRGVRSIMRKLEPGERLVYSLRTVANQGVEPSGYAMGLAAAVRIAGETGETALDFRSLLTDHCGLDSRADADLIALVEARDAALARDQSV